jgi:hypothetical protein
MDEETAKRIERKIDFIFIFLTGLIGGGLGTTIIIHHDLYGFWTTAIMAALVGGGIPAYLLVKYRNIL